MNIRTNNKSRPLFTDGWNSFWHFVFGILTIKYIYILPLFLAYQIIDSSDKNMCIDLAEYFIGVFIAICVINLDLYTAFMYFSK